MRFFCSSPHPTHPVGSVFRPCVFFSTTRFGKTHCPPSFVIPNMRGQVPRMGRLVQEHRYYKLTRPSTLLYDIHKIVFAFLFVLPSSHCIHTLIVTIESAHLVYCCRAMWGLRGIAPWESWSGSGLKIFRSKTGVGGKNTSYEFWCTIDWTSVIWQLGSQPKFGQLQ